MYVCCDHPPYMQLLLVRALLLLELVIAHGFCSQYPGNPGRMLGSNVVANHSLLSLQKGKHSFPQFSMNKIDLVYAPPPGLSLSLLSSWVATRGSPSVSLCRSGTCINIACSSCIRYLSPSWPGSPKWVSMPSTFPKCPTYEQEAQAQPTSSPVLHTKALSRDTQARHRAM